MNASNAAQPGAANDGASDAPTFVADPMGPGGVVLDPAFQEQALEILAVNCGGCHGPMGPARGDFGAVLDVDVLVQSGKVVPGDPDNSPLLKRIESGSMPPPTQALRPSAGDIALLRAWISGAALDPNGPAPEGPEPEQCDNSYVTEDELIEAMARDVFTLDPEDREFTRYITLGAPYNAGLCDSDLARVKLGVEKLMNSLSFEPRIYRPDLVGPWGTLLRIDLREIGWERTVRVEGSSDFPRFLDAWDAVVDDNPYAIERRGVEADDLKRETQTEVPFLPASPFIAFSAIPPLYYEVLGLPDSVDDLEELLGVDVRANLAEERSIRAGFRNSGVSLQDRVIERHDIPASNNQSYWKSFDFLGQLDNDSIFEDPLGFEAQGGEMIFSLPNGLHGYMIADGAGRRVDDAPTAIVADPGRRDFVVRSGVSCMSCHVEGILYKDDQVRSFVLENPLEYDNETYEAVLELYVNADEFNAYQAEDRADYIRSMNELGGRMSEPDPVSHVFVAFEADVTAEVAAAELGVPLDFFRRSLPKLSAELQVLAGDGRIDRDAFSNLFFETLCVLQAVSENTPAGCR
jgi:hypothetical protein